MEVILLILGLFLVAGGFAIERYTRDKIFSFGLGLSNRISVPTSEFEYLEKLIFINIGSIVCMIIGLFVVIVGAALIFAK